MARLVAGLASKSLFVSSERLVKYGDAAEEDLGAMSLESCFAHLLNCDLRRFGEGGVPEGLGKTDVSVLTGPAIVQVLKIANITEPSYAQHTVGSRGRVLMLQVTDGKRECAALEYGPVQGLSLDTPPGTKIRVANAKVRNGVVLLDNRSCAVVGGIVETMKRDWETQRRYSNVARKMMMRERHTGAEGEDIEPPPKFATFTKGAGAEARNQQRQLRQQNTATKADSCQPQQKSDETKQQQSARKEQAKVGSVPAHDMAVQPSQPQPSPLQPSARTRGSGPATRGGTRGRGGMYKLGEDPPQQHLEGHLVMGRGASSTRGAGSRTRGRGAHVAGAPQMRPAPIADDEDFWGGAGGSSSILLPESRLTGASRGGQRQMRGSRSGSNYGGSMYAADAEGSGAGGTMSDEAMARMLQRQFDQEAEMHEAETRLHNVLALNTVQPTVNPPLAAANAEVSGA